MSDVIKLLPDSVANQIAAGEVIQRPASVIKELVENAIDAHADDITIVLKDAGRTLIQVVDNGEGMSDTDARLAFERHSTSKIRSASDLFSLHTMGFRGEALASIAAVSQLELRTTKRGNEIGTHLIISASKCESQEADVCPVGCNFMVKNLFFNVPARRKFLKAPKIELANIVKEFERLALVNPMVEFTMHNNDSVMYKLQPGNVKQRIMQLFGNKIEEQLIPISIDTTLVRIEGFVCKPENARKRNFIQYFFVNGRYMRHPYFHKAVLSSYEQLIPEGAQPNYFLYFTVDPETIDVNIHPTKTEIKFENELPIWQILSAAIKESLGRFSIVPSIDFDTDDAPEIPIFHVDNNRTKESVPSIGGNSGAYNPFKDEDTQSSYPKIDPVVDWEKLYQRFEKSRMDSFEDAETDISDDIFIEPSVEPNDNNSLQLGNVDDGNCLQIQNKYIVSQVKSGLMIIDQHRAHVKVLFDKFLKQISGRSSISQRIMFPEILHLSGAQQLMLESVQEELENVGFDLSNLGNNDWSINGVPAGVDGIDVKDLLLQVIDSVAEGGKNVAVRIKEHIAMVIAEKAAIPYGRALSAKEMDTLIGNLLQLDAPNYTQDGKIVINIMTIDSINKLFQG